MQIILAGTSEEQIWLQQESHKFISAVLYSRLKILFSSLFSKDTLVPSPRRGRYVQWGQQRTGLMQPVFSFKLHSLPPCPTRLGLTEVGQAGKTTLAGDYEHINTECKTVL